MNSHQRRVARRKKARLYNGYDIVGIDYGKEITRDEYLLALHAASGPYNRITLHLDDYCRLAYLLGIEKKDRSSEPKNRGTVDEFNGIDRSLMEDKTLKAWSHR